MTTRGTQRQEQGASAHGHAPVRGDVLAERYRLLRQLGSGGMGVVWEAVHVALDTKVAIKLIDPRRAGDERAQQRFLREAKSAASLQSPHVVQIHDYGLHDDAPYIAMEKLEGESLADRLARVGMLDTNATLAVVEDVGRAIAKAHASEIVHRDLKPDNIFLCETDDGEIAKVLDFGIAKGLSGADAADVTTGIGGLLGTPQYMSPEQLMNASDCDARSDLWALSVIVYECLLGQKAYTADSVAELAVAVLAEPAPVPSDHGLVPPGFDAWFERATRRDPDERYGTVAQMLDALRPVLRGARAPEALPASPVRARRPWGWVVLAVLGAAGMVADAAWPARDEPAPRRAPEEQTKGHVDPPRASAADGQQRPDEPSPKHETPGDSTADDSIAATPTPPEASPPSAQAGELGEPHEAKPSLPPEGEEPSEGEEPPARKPRAKKPKPPRPTVSPPATEPDPPGPEKQGYDIDELERP